MLNKRFKQAVGVMMAISMLVASNNVGVMATESLEFADESGTEDGLEEQQDGGKNPTLINESDDMILQDIDWDITEYNLTATGFSDNLQDEYSVCPYEIDGYEYYAIQFPKANGFGYKWSIPSGDSANSVGHIKDYAFMGFGNNGEKCSLDLPFHLRSIGTEAFKNCTAITGTLALPGWVTTIGSGAFENCTGLDETIGIYVGVTSPLSDCIDENGNQFTNPFKNCKNVKKIINNSASELNLTEVNPNAVWYDNNDNIVTVISKGQVAHRRFSEDEHYEYFVKEDGSAKLVSAYALYPENYEFNSIDGIPATIDGYTVTELGDYLYDYYNGSRIETGVLKIPDKVKKIGNYAFRDFECGFGNDYKINLDLGQSIEYIGDYAFNTFKGKNALDIPASVKKIGAYAFSGSTGFTTTNICAESIGEHAFDTFSTDTITSLVLSENVKNIGDYAFSNNSGLKEIVIPSSVESIGENILYNCGSLERITNNSAVTLSLEQINNDCVWIDSSSLEIITEIKDGQTAVIKAPDEPLTIIAEGTDWNSNLEWKIDSEGLLTISGTEAPASYEGMRYDYWYADWKYYNSDIKKAYIDADNLTSMSNMFSWLDNIEEVDLSDCDISKVSDIYATFSGCSNLKTVKIPESGFVVANETYASNTFENCVSLESVILPSGISGASDVFKGCTNLKRALIPRSVRYVNTCFEGCSSLEELVFEGSRDEFKRVNIYDPNGNMNTAKWHYGHTLDFDLMSDDAVVRIAEVNKTHKLSMRDADGNMINNSNVTWTSSDTSKVTVSPDGVLTAVSIGSAIITAQMGKSQELIYVFVGNDYGIKIESHSLLLDSQIGIDFIVSIDAAHKAEVMDQCRAILKRNGTNPVIVEFDKAHRCEDKGGKELYFFSYPISVKDVNNTVVTIDFADDGGNLFKINNVDANAATYSVADYIKEVEGNKGGFSEAKKGALLQELYALADYSGYAKAYFSGGSYTAQDDNVRNQMAQVTKDTFKDYQRNVTKTSDVFTYVGSSLVLGDTMTIKHYYKPIECGYSHWEGGEPINRICAEPVNYEDNLWNMSIRNLAGADLNKTYTVTYIAEMYDGSRETMTIEYSPYSYMYSALSRSETDSLADLIKAMYVYNQMTLNYFRKTTSGNTI